MHSNKTSMKLFKVWLCPVCKRHVAIEIYKEHMIECRDNFFMFYSYPFPTDNKKRIRL